MSITLLIVIVTAAISIAAFQNHELNYRLIFNPYKTEKDREWYRFITAGFIHADWIHLFFNMFVLYEFGRIVEAYFEGMNFLLPKFNFLFMYLLTIVLSHMRTFFKYRDASFYNSLGASGGVSGVLFAFVVFEPLAKIAPYGISFLSLPSIVWGVAYLFYSTYMSKKGGDNINHDAHLWGALVGIAYVIIQKPEVITRWFSAL